MSNSRLVYSTDDGDRRERRPPGRTGPQVPRDGVVRVFREQGGRRGKTVTVVRGLSGGDLDAVAGELKRLCGSGGTVKDGAVELQGDHRDRVAGHLQAKGFRVKLAGG
jgi:translation initiation factor 1